MRSRYIQAIVDLFSPRLRSAGVLRLLDQYYSGSTWSEGSPELEGVSLSTSSAEWSAYKALFGQASLMAAVTSAAGTGGGGGELEEVVVPAIASSTLLVNGANNAVEYLDRADVHVTGPTASVIINGVENAAHGTELMLKLNYDFDTVVNHASTSAAVGQRICTPSGGALTLYAPGPSPAYNVLAIKYDTSLLGGDGGWWVTGYITGEL